MKKLILLSIMIATSTLWAEENVGVKVDQINTNQDTTISIKKGESVAKKKYVLTEGEEEISGEKDVIKKKAEKNWLTACNEWKKDFRNDNKDNKIVSLNCGKMICTKEGVESTCVSKAIHKVRVLSEE